MPSRASIRPSRAIEVDIGAVDRLDTFGAWLLERIVRLGTTAGGEARIVGVPDHYRGLLAEIRDTNKGQAAPNPISGTLRQGLELVGRMAVPRSATRWPRFCKCSVRSPWRSCAS